MEGAHGESLYLDYHRLPNEGMALHWNVKEAWQDDPTWGGIRDHEVIAKPGWDYASVQRMKRIVGLGSKVATGIGVVLDVYAVATSDKPRETAEQKLGAWGCAIICGEIGATSGAEVGTAILPGWGTLIGGVTVGTVCSIMGYIGGEKAVQRLQHPPSTGNYMMVSPFMFLPFEYKPGNPQMD